MALAFRRATAAAEEAFAGYVSQYRDYYGFRVDKPIEFDWESAKAIAGESKFNSNEEVLPRAITVVNCIKDSPNYLCGMVSNIAYKATDDYKALAFDIQNRVFSAIVMHFDDKSTKSGECTWTCEIRDHKLHATMHYAFDSYCGRQNFEDVCEWTLDYLDVNENLFFEIEKAKILADYAKESPSMYTNSDGIAYLRGAAPGKDWKIEWNWDEIAKVTGKSIIYSNQPPKANTYVLVYTLENDRLMYVVHWALDVVLKDDVGKEAFVETFDSVLVNLRPAPAHAASVAKAGKTLVFNFNINMADHQNASRSYEYAVLGKAIEAML